MKIAIGADHGGFAMKTVLMDYLKQKGHSVLDVGCYSPESCDYPEFGYRVAKLVGDKKADRGVLICKSGIGISIVANKVKGARAALCLSLPMAKSSREHNDANIIVFGALQSKEVVAKRMLSVWLKTKALGGRHAKRIKQIEEIETAEFN
ncbi:MAG: ribose 5-phosphate isomerase B [Candidatus Omnitrophota bacterium]